MITDDEIKHLDEQGRCCGRKPLVYKRRGFHFCTRCCYYFDFVTGEGLSMGARYRKQQAEEQTTTD